MVLSCSFLLVRLKHIVLCSVDFEVASARGGEHGRDERRGLTFVSPPMLCSALVLAPAHALRHTPFATPLLLAVAILTLVGLLSSTVYNARTPDLYVHNGHGPLGWVLVVLFFAVGGWDVWGAVRGVEEGGWRAKCWRLLGVETRHDNRGVEYGRAGAEEQAGLQTIAELDEDDGSAEKGAGEEEDVVLFSASSPEGQRRQDAHARLTGLPLSALDDELSPRSSSSTLRHHNRSVSPSLDSDDGLRSGRQTAARRLVRIALTVAWFLVPVMGVASFLSGITVYAGACRAGELLFQTCRVVYRFLCP